MTPTYPARWTSPAWREPALAWAAHVLDVPGFARVEQPRARPWSTLLRLEDAAGSAWWLKGCAPGTGFEPALLTLLAGLGVPAVPQPRAAAPSRRLVLLPDGGPTLREAHGTPDRESTARLLRAAAAIARASDEQVPALLAAGVPDLRPEAVLDALDRLLDDPWLTSGPHPLPDELRPRVARALPRLRDDVALLASGPVRPGIQHDDLHDGNALASPLVVIDWGDASVAHPFATLLVALNAHAHARGLPREDPELAWLRDAYLEQWSDLAPRAELAGLAAAAVRLAPVGRALAWRRALADADDASQQEWGDGVAGWLEELVGDDLPLQG